MNLNKMPVSLSFINHLAKEKSIKLGSPIFFLWFFYFGFRIFFWHQKKQIFKTLRQIPNF